MGRKKKIIYELKVGADGFVRHKPCFYTQIMKIEQECMELYGKQLQTIHKEKWDLPDWKDLCRWFINDAKSRHNKAKRDLEKICVGLTSCPAL